LRAAMSEQSKPAQPENGKVKKERKELPSPPYVWISWLILAAYFFVAIEGALACVSYPWHKATSASEHFPGDEVYGKVVSAQLHLCILYLVESALAAGPGWCAMAPGWTRSELLAHHVPYVAAVAIAFLFGCAPRWVAPMCAVLLTPVNEGLFIVQSLGGPEWLAKVRRVYGFCVVAFVLSCETMVILRNTWMHWRGDWTWAVAIQTSLDQIAWGATHYHLKLLRLYIRRWKKTRSL